MNMILALGYEVDWDDFVLLDLGFDFDIVPLDTWIVGVVGVVD